MHYSYEDVETFIQEENVKFIRLAFFDVFGVQKNISILPQELKRAFSEGISFDASAIAGFGDDRKERLVPAAGSIHPGRPALAADGRAGRAHVLRYHVSGRHTVRKRLPAHPEAGGR